MNRLFLVALLLLACSQSPPTSPVTPAPAPPTAAPAVAGGGRFVLTLTAGASPGLWKVELDAKGSVFLGWEGGSISYELPEEARNSIGQDAAAALQAFGAPGEPQGTAYEELSYQPPEGETLSYRLSEPGDVALGRLAEDFRGLIPSRRGVGPEVSWAVGLLEAPEGDSYPLRLGDEILELRGDLPKELVGRQILVTGELLEDNTGALVYMVREFTPWPPEGSLWQGQAVPEGLRARTEEEPVAEQPSPEPASPAPQDAPTKPPPVEEEVGVPGGDDEVEPLEGVKPMEGLKSSPKPPEPTPKEPDFQDPDFEVRIDLDDEAPSPSPEPTSDSTVKGIDSGIDGVKGLEGL